MEPKILILTMESWNSRVGANTYSALFSHYPPENVYNIFFREEIPDDACCKHYFQISEMQAMRSVFSRKTKTGREITEEERNRQQNAENLKKSRVVYAKYGKSRPLLGLYAREILWWASAWKSKELDAFLEKAKPDVVVAEMASYVFYNRICEYVAKKTGARVIGYFIDDSFTYKQTKTDLSFLGVRPFIRRSLKRLAKVCDAFWAITEKTKREADAVFGIDCRVLTKPISFAPDEKWEPYEVHDPIRMLYAGKLGIGRFGTVKDIAKTLRQVNGNREKIGLDVYTTTFLTEKQKKSSEPFVRFHPPVSRDELQNIEAEADVLLFAEAYRGSQAKISRLSFSTKLTDYLHSGKCIFAVGHQEVAPMEYLQAEHAAVCATDRRQIREAIAFFAEQPNRIPAFGKAAFDCGKKNHSAQKIRETVDDTIRKLLTEGDRKP